MSRTYTDERDVFFDCVDDDDERDVFFDCVDDDAPLSPKPTLGTPKILKFRLCQENPKLEQRLGTVCASWLRYESYKTAKNYEEFLFLGGTQRDLVHDLKHNYLCIS